MKKEDKHANLANTFFWLDQFFRKILLLLERFSEKRWWLFWLVIISTSVSLFFAFPSYESIDPDVGRLPYVLRQTENLPEFWNTHPVSNINFRITVPLIAHVLNLNLAGIFFLQALAGIALFGLVAIILTRMLSDRVVASLIALAVGLTIPGITAFSELRGTFDGFAIFFIVAALWARPAWLIGILVFFASWTDERSFLAAGFVCIWWAFMEKGVDRFDLYAFFNPRSMSVLFAGGVYLIGRYYIAHKYGLIMEDQNAVLVTGQLKIIGFINNIPMAIWTALEGLWLVIVVAILSLWRRNRLAFWLYILPIAFMIFLGASVNDMTRSMAYIFPAVFIGFLVMWSDLTSDQLRDFSLLVFAICLFWPAYSAGGKSTVWWHYPLPMQIIRWVIGR